MYNNWAGNLCSLRLLAVLTDCFLALVLYVDYRISVHIEFSLLLENIKTVLVLNSKINLSIITYNIKLEIYNIIHSYIQLYYSVQKSSFIFNNLMNISCEELFMVTLKALQCLALISEILPY